MKEQLMGFIADVRSNNLINNFDEATTKQAIILRLLSTLSWNIFDTSEGYIGEIIDLITLSSLYSIDNNIEKIDIKSLKNCGFVKPSLRKHINDILDL